MIIALSGYGGCGKDTVADILVEEFGFYKYAWADTLRMAASALNPIVEVDEYGAALRYNDVVAAVGYNEAKFAYPEVREILQRLGTEVGRELIGDNVWVNATLSRIERERLPGENIVIADTRFLNEANVLTNGSFHFGRGENLVVRVERPGVAPAGAHISETALDDYKFDRTIINDGSLDDLRTTVIDLFKNATEELSGLRLF